MLPEFSLGPFVSLPTYFIYLSLLSSLWIWFVWLWGDRMHMRQDQALNLAMIVLVAGVFGGRVLHVLFEAPDYYRRFPAEIFKVWRGGFVFYGGLFAGFGAGCLYARWQKLNILEWFDFFAPLLAVGYGLGRGACFLAGCCYGKFCAWPWAVAGRHPTQLYALIFELLAAFVLLRLALANHAKRRDGLAFGVIALLWVGLHAVGRLFMEYFRDDFRGSPLGGLSISTWISLVLLAISLAGLMHLWLLPRMAKRSKKTATKKEPR